jgi:hypothetical protein
MTCKPRQKYNSLNLVLHDEPSHAERNVDTSVLLKGGHGSSYNTNLISSLERLDNHTGTASILQKQGKQHTTTVLERSVFHLKRDQVIGRRSNRHLYDWPSTNDHFVLAILSYGNQ